LAVITGLWTTPAGERFSYAGTHYIVDDSPALPKPVQQPHPPIVIGGFGAKRTPALAARYASEFNVAFAPVEGFPEIAGRVRAACEAIGRDPASLGFSIANTVVCGADDAEVDRRIAAIGRPREMLAGAMVGTPAAVADLVGAYRDAGADTVYFQVLDLHDLDHLRLLAAEVLPRFR
jgi:alkanesulfonate monooxygenase SsuD/methylene tetrahydromethanopterin reductase-like flavin-dependent oxidoreductase (luciferase family)